MEKALCFLMTCYSTVSGRVCWVSLREFKSISFGAGGERKNKQTKKSSILRCDKSLCIDPLAPTPITTLICFHPTFWGVLDGCAAAAGGFGVLPLLFLGWMWRFLGCSWQSPLGGWPLSQGLAQPPGALGLLVVLHKFL